jgi:hypothetical protein
MKVIIINTADSNVTTFDNIEATTFGELKTALTKVDFSNKTVVERTSRNSLEIDEARLPNAEELILYVTQKKVKAGADYADMSRNELTSIAKNLRETSEAAKSFLGNYTTMSSNDLRSKLTEWDVQSADDTEEIADAKDAIIAKLDIIIAESQEARSLIQAYEGGGEIFSFEELRMERLITEGQTIKKALIG